MKNLSLTTKLIIFVSILGIVCVSLIVFVSINETNIILNKAAVKEIESVELTKKTQIEGYLKRCITSIEVLKRLPTINSLFTELESNKKSIKIFNSSRVIADIASDNKLKDVYFMDKSANLLLGINSSNVNIEAKPVNMSIITSLWKTCINSNRIHFSDIHMDDNGKAVLYIGSKILENDKLIGVIISSIDINPIGEILSFNTENSKSLESYLVGSDMKLRSKSRFNKGENFLNQKVNTTASQKVFEGYKGTEIINNYQGNEVLSSYNKIDINGLNWAIITEIDKEEIYAPKNSLINSIVIISIIVLILMFPSLYYIGRIQVKPLKLEIVYAKKLADGYLDAELDIYQKDEIGVLADALRQMAKNTHKVIETVINATNNLADASFQISGASQDISTGASEQASSIEEVSASIEEMTSNIKQNASNAEKTEKITKEVNSQVSDGSKVILSTVEAMEIIADKISIISDIAFQTNILALNASVEAARAGEYGKGFGVVASEVGKLADKTKSAAAEINNITKSSVEVAEKTKNIMNQIVPSIKNSTLLIQEISAASKEQKDAADQINNAIQMLNDISQQNAASSEEMATNSEELSGQAEQLLNVISHFKTSNQNNYKPNSKENKHKLITGPKKKGHRKSIKNDNLGVDINLGDDISDSEFEKF